MQPQFIKLGDRILNLAHVVQIDFYPSKDSLEARVITTGQWSYEGGQGEPNYMLFKGRLAESLASYFDTDVAPPSFLIDITHLAPPAEEQQP
ncbi:hypothetical protein [Gloeobacter kilaueensis]|uniref:Uncharacterized protein n=1 Tax=Gloeobacter kilaueensis (strain ATCC BAA-2537 / CCAP 1431/1 / ULC 316 / JS1) TaxID=1183438 RepID=U5QDU4_GLOK1|nr:hypothetical protein [Gloeobacter kilaueensis]AGY57038.1 hypothetical protein GKIL_0792 [Gloeobacter kilaueensis JS1]